MIAISETAPLTDADGKEEYIDLLASASHRPILGTVIRTVVQAITQQAQKLIQYTPAYFANFIATIGTRLTKLAPMTGPVKLA